MAKNIPITVLLDDDLDTLVRVRAEEKKMSIADVVRQALLRYFEGEE